MKFKIYDEEFTSEESRKSHYEKHVVRNKEFLPDNLSEEEYEKLGDELALTPHDCSVFDPATKGTVAGYYSLDKNNRPAYNKYNKKTGLFVTYRPEKKNGRPQLITVHVKTWQELMNTVWGGGSADYSYKDELPKGE